MAYVIKDLAYDNYGNCCSVGDLQSVSGGGFGLVHVYLVKAVGTRFTFLNSTVSVSREG